MKAKITLLLCGLVLTFNLSAQYVYTLSLKVNKMGYDSKRDLIYATIKGSDPNYANSFVAINPYEGKILNSVFVGSEPTEFEFTSDSSFVYICFDELPMVKKFDLNAFVVTMDIILGTDSGRGSMYGQDLATIPGHDNLVVVSRKFNSGSPNFAGIAVYSNGNKLSRTTPGHTGPERIETTGSNNLYGYADYNKVYSITVDVDSGAYITGANEVVAMKDIEFENGLLFGTNGKVIDTKYTPPIQIGTYPLYTIDVYDKFDVAPDSKNNKVFFNTVKGRSIEFYSFDRTTFARKDTFIVKDIIPTNFQSPAISNLIRFGKRGLAATVFEDYVFSNNQIQLSLINNLPMVDTAESNNPLHPNLFILDTVRVFKYDTIQIASNDTLIFHILSSSIENQILAGVKIYPNPTKEHLFVDIPDYQNLQNYRIKIYDTQGRLLYEDQVYWSQMYIDVSYYTKGTYLLQVLDSETKVVANKKIIIK